VYLNSYPSSNGEEDLNHRGYHAPHISGRSETRLEHLHNGTDWIGRKIPVNMQPLDRYGIGKKFKSAVSIRYIGIKVGSAHIAM